MNGNMDILFLRAVKDETSGSALVLESPNDSFFPPLQLESESRDGTNVGDGIANESWNRRCSFIRNCCISW